MNRKPKKKKKIKPVCESRLFLCMVWVVKPIRPNNRCVWRFCRFYSFILYHYCIIIIIIINSSWILDSILCSTCTDCNRIFFHLYSWIFCFVFIIIIWWILFSWIQVHSCDETLFMCVSWCWSIKIMFLIPLILYY